jgi:hypothetical protein
MELSHQLRDAAKAGMEEMSEKFKDGGGAIYRPKGEAAE